VLAADHLVFAGDGALICSPGSLDDGSAAIEHLRQSES
jgi:hypothetical protein